MLQKELMLKYLY